ncbi:ammonium transporter (TC 1.A.11) [Thiothrix eikelboomii]|uniref:Ammonium transporter n=1 Tax=Thiothrix eikelboomii TaxID=92487 RepID=A0A1T4WQM2_9GAMM|nr:ammonium transporter [Thiothrix eikelboomii]SKA79672.1 ammonium transporter (TC 1.A.11) [Thiothrix eikelboomii]
MNFKLALMLVGAVFGLSGLALAQEASTAVAEAAPAAPTPDKGDTVWMMISTILVIMMVIPGLALFYGGLVRAKNMLSVLAQVFSIFCLIALLWVMYGYSLAFTDGGSLNSFIGGFDKLFLTGVDPSVTVETFSKGVVIHEMVFVIFQLTFAAITVSLIVGGFAERIKFSALLLFCILWFTFSYLPMAHMVWFWGGPSAYDAPAGFLFAKGALDFAGGTVVHINAAMAALVGAIVVGKRVGYGRDSMAPHNLVMTMIGASLLWVGWFGFNAGSNLEATGTAVLAMLNTIVATAAAGLSWMMAEWLLRGKPSLLGVVSGAVSGLVAITPAAGFAGPMGAIVLGLVTGAACLWGVTGLKHMLGYDDSLDVFGVHGIGGILGAIGTGILVNPALGGSGVFDYSTGTVAAYNSAQILSQLWGVGVAILWSGVVSFVILMLLKYTIGLRVSQDEERQGLDTVTHGERAYTM